MITPLIRRIKVILCYLLSLRNTLNLRIVRRRIWVRMVIVVIWLSIWLYCRWPWRIYKIATVVHTSIWRCHFISVIIYNTERNLYSISMISYIHVIEFNWTCVVILILHYVRENSFWVEVTCIGSRCRPIHLIEASFQFGSFFSK